MWLYDVWSTQGINKDAFQMKIGILTFHDALNCGAVLQAFALQVYLESLGHEIEFINYSCRPSFSLKRIVGKTLSNTKAKIVDFINATIYGHDKAYNQILNVSYRKYSEVSIESTNDDYDLFIVGSDQVWNFMHSLAPAYLLDFVHAGKKKIAYAVSMGQCNVPVELHRDLKEKLESFSAISCREINAVVFLNKLLGHPSIVCQCVDPTLLITKSHYHEIAIMPKAVGYITSYILNRLSHLQHNMIESYCSKRELQLINLRNPDTCIKLSFAKNLIVRPTEWLGYIQNSAVVICGSFHATVFSLIFHKPFIVIESEDVYNSGGNQRIRSLLRPLGLEYRCIYTGDMDAIIERHVDWEYIDERIKSMRAKSQDFLNNSLS